MRAIISAALVIVAIVVFYIGIDPIYQQVKDLRLQAADYNKALDNSAELRRVRNNLVSKYNALDKESLDRAVKMLPDGVDNIRLILDINGVAAKYGMSIKNIKIENSAAANLPGQSQNPIGILQLSFSVTSSYENFTQFMSDLENSLRLVDVSNLSFTANDKDNTNVYNVTLQTYWLK